MNMKSYKKTIITRIILLSVLALFAVGFGTYDAFFATAEIKSNNVFSFQCGLTIALGTLALVCIIRYSKALRNNKKLQEQYIKENDERIKAIRAKAGIPIYLVFSIIMIVVGIIIGYFNELIFITLIATAAIQLLLACAIKLIYTKIY